MLSLLELFLSLHAGLLLTHHEFRQGVWNLVIPTFNVPNPNGAFPAQTPSCPPPAFVCRKDLVSQATPETQKAGSS